jgi:cytochrome c
MKSKLSVYMLIGIAVLLLSFPKISMGQERATPQEVVEKVQRAANTLAESGAAGLSQFNQKDGPWVWKDTYVFVFDCPKGTIAAHPMRPDLIGTNATSLTGTKGRKFFPKLCQAMNTPSGVWVEYWWPKPGETEGSRKISYALRAGNTPYLVGAGIYDDKATIEELKKLTSGVK